MFSVDDFLRTVLKTFGLLPPLYIELQGTDSWVSLSGARVFFLVKTKVFNSDWSSHLRKRPHTPLQLLSLISLGAWILPPQLGAAPTHRVHISRQEEAEVLRTEHMCQLHSSFC